MSTVGRDRSRHARSRCFPNNLCVSADLQRCGLAVEIRHECLSTDFPQQSCPPLLYHRAMKPFLLSLFAVVAVVAAAEKTPEKTPRMRDGHPDLSGNWTYATLTTLERPKEFGNKAFLTEAEAAEFEKKTLVVQNRDRRDGEGPDGRGTGGRTDLDRAYGPARGGGGRAGEGRPALDGAGGRGGGEYEKKIAGPRRTSLIIDPPDGRIPA